MTVFAIGLDHATAPLALRERFAFPADALRRRLEGLRTHLGPAGQEVAILSTCNRTELYVGGAHGSPAGAGTDPATLADAALAWLAVQGDVAPARLLGHSYRLHEAEAARHAFRVASGLESMVLGEPQILGQMKHAVREAEEAGVLGTTLHQLFQRSFSVAKEVRTRTGIASHAVSLGAAAAGLARQLFGTLAGRHVLLVGAGEMIELVATHLLADAPATLRVANRSAERAQALCERLRRGPAGAGTDREVHTPTGMPERVSALPLSGLGERLHEFDVIVSCTASTLPLIGLGAVGRALKVRRHRPMLMFDLAVPRDIEPEVGALDDVYLYTVDDLRRHVQVGGERRREAVAQAERIVGEGVSSFEQWIEHRASVPLIRAVQRQADAWRDVELARARRALARGGDVDAVLEAMSGALTRKLLHGALSELHHSVGASHRDCADALRRLFLREGHDDAPDGRVH
jgi:glutamyl-tRNA reductase